MKFTFISRVPQMTPQSLCVSGQVKQHIQTADCFMSLCVSYRKSQGLPSTESTGCEALRWI